jgi:phosphoribosylglycinamide formyltransferase 1
MLKIGVLVSGGGTNLQAILDKIEEGYLRDCMIAAVVSSRKDAYALKRARIHGIESTALSPKMFSTPDEYDAELIAYFKRFDIGLVVMAGFLSRIGTGFMEEYKNRIINIHPSLIPSFCGKGYYGIIPHQKALEYGVKVTGATVHFVEGDYDTGPIILQRAVYVKDDDTPESLQRRVMKEAEWEILPEAIKMFSEGSLKIEGRKVIRRH